MAGVPDAPSPNFFGKPSAKRPKCSPTKGVKRYHTIYLSTKRVFYRYGNDFVHFYSNSLTRMNREKIITKIRKIENIKRIILFRVS